MDEIDRTLLSLLRQDARQPLKALGAGVGLSASSVRDRIMRLEESGAIRRYTVETAPEGDALSALLSLRLHATPNPALVRTITARADVVRCYSLAGPVDLIMEIRAESIDAINAARDEIAILDGVAQLETALVLKREKAPD